MSNHTPEPWSKNAISPTVYDGDGIAILRCEGRTLIAENEANARRIVACVNACVGIGNETLESIATHGLAGAAQHLATLTAQRDELLQTVKAVQTMCHGAIRVRIDGIIAKCEVKNDA